MENEMKLTIYPKNKEYFKRLIPFVKKIILICKENKIFPVIQGSFAHFYYTKDESIKVNDIDLLIQKKDFEKFMSLLKKTKIKFRYYPKWNTIIIKKGKLKIEVDDVGKGYKTLKDKNLIKSTSKINFYGIEFRMITLRQLEEIYPIAYARSIEDKVKLLKKIKHLERFLGRKVK